MPEPFVPMKNPPPPASAPRSLWILLLAVGLLLARPRLCDRTSRTDGPPPDGACLLAQNGPGVLAPPADPDAPALAQAPEEPRQPRVPPETDFSAVAQRVAEVLPATHLLREPLDEVKSARAWTNYLAALDFERLYFRQEDIAEFEPHRLRLGEELLAGDLAFAAKAYARYLQRVEERVNRLETLLQNPFDFSIPESYQWKRREAPWPASLAEQDELWRKRVKNEILARIIARELKQAPADEARETRGTPPVPGQADDRTADPPDEAPPAAETVPPPVHEAPGAPPETPATKEAGAEDGEDPDETHEEFILKRYRRFLTILKDNDAEDPMSRFLGAVAMAFDPHTGYLSPVSLEDFGINMQLSLQGIGAQLRPEDGTARVVEIIPGGPADRDTRDIRLVPGDQIIGVGQDDGPITDTLHWPLYKTVRLIRGPKGTKVVLLVQPMSDPSRTTTKKVDLIRDEVRLEEQAATSSVETVADAAGTPRKLGILRLPTFYSSVVANNGGERRGAALDVARLLAELNTEAVEGLVLDLRGNGGGALKEAIDLVGLFIRTGPVVLVKEGVRVHTLADRDPAVAFRKPVVVLIDRISASASEIVAGALQDYGRAIVAGDSRSHGKGTVQQIIPLDEQGVLGSIKVTNASFYRINGSSTQSRGVAADIVLPSPFDFFTELGEDKLPNAIPWSTIRPAWFRPVADLGPTLAVVRERSLARRTAEERWQRHDRRLARIEHLQNLREIPLEIEARRTFAIEERELEEIEEQIEEENATRKEREAARRAQDVVLDEALRILVDFIDVHGPLTSLTQPAAPAGIDDLFERFFR